MGLNDEYLKLRKKRLEEEEKEEASSNKQLAPLFVNKTAALYNVSQKNKDIAPVKSTKKDTSKKENEEEERKWFEKGAFEDGYQFGDVTKTILGTVTDTVENVGAGIIGMGEKLVDTAAYVAPYIAKGQFYQNGGTYMPLTQQKVFDEGIEATKKANAEFIKKDLYDEEKVAKKIISAPVKNITGIDAEEDSVFGEKTDALAQSGGQLLATAGLQAVGVPWFVTTGVTSFGSEVENAYKEGADHEEAGISAAISAGAEILTEKLSGGIKFGGKAVDDVLVKQLSRGISNKTLRTMAKLGMDAVGEGGEEILSGFLSAVGQKMTYMDDKELSELFTKEDVFDSFMGGVLLGGGANVLGAVKSEVQGKDAVTGLTKNEQKVVDKVYKDDIAKEEQGGKKLSVLEKSKLYDKVVEDMDKGRITTDTIEEVLGGDTFKSYKDTVAQEKEVLNELSELYEGDELKQQIYDFLKNAESNNLRTKLSDEVFELVKDSRLAETYNERGRKRQAFEADLSQYEPKYHETIKKAVESGILNNTRRTHELVDLIAKISADKGVSFDFTNNQRLKESGFAVDGKQVNGFVTENGVTLNVQSTKALNRIVGHEITHVLEGTELYDVLQETVFEYAKGRKSTDAKKFDSEYKERLYNTRNLYKDVDGYRGVEGFKKIKNEVVADLVGDYIFSDTDFINSLSVNNRNVFEKIYDEVKYLAKVATAGSKEARELERVKRAFENAYRESGKQNEGTKYHISKEFEAEIDKTLSNKLDKSNQVKARDFTPELLVNNGVKDLPMLITQNHVKTTVYSEAEAKKLGLPTGKNINYHGLGKDLLVKAVDNMDDPSAIYRKDADHYLIITELQNKAGEPIMIPVKIDGKGTYNDVYIDENQILSAYGKKNLQSYLENNDFELIYKKRETALNEGVQYSDIGDFSDDNVAQKDADVKYSLSDSDGKQLTKEQQEYFKDSKVRDDNGNLKVMYHGSTNAGFHVFDPKMSDDYISMFFVDRNDVAATYSGSGETYAAKAFRSAEDANNFFAEIGMTQYEVQEKDGKYTLYDDGDEVATSESLSEIYDEFRDWEGVGYGDANYKVYLNLTNPLEVDAKGRNWNNISREYSQEIADRYHSLTAEEKAALADIAGWGEYGIFRDELLSAAKNARAGAAPTSLASAVEKLGGANANLYDAFSIASDNFSEEAIKQFAMKQMKTRDYAQRAKEQGYDGVIFKNIVDNGGYSNGNEGAATVAIAFDSEQIKSIANDKPTRDKDIRNSLSREGEQFAPVGRNDVFGRDIALEQDIAPVAISETKTSTEEPVAPVPEVDVAENATTTEAKLNELGELRSQILDRALELDRKRGKTEAEVFEMERLYKQADEIKREIDDLGAERYYPAALYSKRDGANGWGNVYSTAQEALNAAVRKVNPTLWSDIEREIEQNYGLKRSNTPMTTALIAVQEDVRQDTITPIQGAQLLNEAYTRYGAKALGKLYYPGTGNLYPAYLERAKQYESVAPIREAAENIAPTVTEAELFPDNYAPTAEEEEAYQSGRIASLDDADAPPEMEAPYYEDEAITADDPFADRQIEDIGNRKVKAYMYENPEVKPFFQAEARVMLSELGDSIKGERWYNDQLYYDTGGEHGWGGTRRYTSEDIAYLLDGGWGGKGYTYKQIQAGLNAIIEDNGKENNAVSKRIEFILNERLKNGYTDFRDGVEIPPDQDYIKLLNEKQINEYSAEAFDRFMANADEYAPEDIAPVAMRDIAPSVTEAYEAITPKKEKEPKLAKATPVEQVRAKILTEEPESTKKKSGIWSVFKDNFVDKGTIFEKISLQTGNRELQARFKSIGRAESRAQWFMEHGNAATNSLKSIRETVESSGKTAEFYEYLYHLHNADRMSLEERFEGMENKPVIGYDVTADMSKETAAALEKANPEFKEYAQEVYGYMTHLRQMLVDGGVISEDTAKLWAKMYPHYVPVRRKGDEGLNINVALDTRRTGVNAPVKKATGGNRDILPLFDTMAMRTEQTFKAVAKNRFGVELKNMIGRPAESEAVDVDELIDSIDNNDELLQEGKNGKNPTFTVFENGEKVTFEINDEMYDTMKPKNRAYAQINNSPISKVLQKANDIRRGLITEYNPAFMFTNPIKDIQDVLINSQHPARTYANIPKAISELWNKNGHWYQEYMENGGEQNTYFDDDTKTFAKEKGTLAKVIGFPLERISAANNFIERIPRMAEYIASREEGRSIDVAMLDAARVTTDFSAGGDVVKLLNRNGFTFLNASVQGFTQHVRNIREARWEGWKGWAKLATKVTVAGLPALLLNHLLWDDDEDYAELSDYVKQNYYIVGKYGDGKFVRIPKGRALAVIQDVFERVGSIATNLDDMDGATLLEHADAVWDLSRANLAPNNPLENNIIAPITQAAKNKAWYGDDLVPTRLQDLPAAEQFDESTDSVSRWLGEKLNISPYKINYILDQYSGGVGDAFLPMLTPEAEKGNKNALGDLIAPLRDKFTTDAVMNNQNVSDFYDTKDKLTVNANASGASDEDVLMSKYMNSMSSEIGKLYGEKREIQNSDLSDAEKYDAVREIQKQIIALTKESLNTYEDIRYEDDHAIIGDRYYKKNEEGEWQKLSDDQVTKYEVTSEAGDAPYASDGEHHYRWYEPGEDSESEAGWRKITDDQLDKQKEVTSALGITPEEYWGKKEEYDYAYEYPESYAVAKAVGGYDSYKAYTGELYDIKADKDANGKSITGSRKEKVADYINNLDADYYTKIILFKNEYNADDTYNYEIIDYLNGRDDISFEEMTIILKKLGFEVDAKGNISW